MESCSDSINAKNVLGNVFYVNVSRFSVSPYYYLFPLPLEEPTVAFPSKSPFVIPYLCDMVAESITTDRSWAHVGQHNDLDNWDSNPRLRVAKRALKSLGLAVTSNVPPYNCSSGQISNKLFYTRPKYL